MNPFTQQHFTPHVSIEKASNGYVVTIDRDNHSFFEPLVEAVKSAKGDSSEAWKDLQKEENLQLPKSTELFIFTTYAELEAFLKMEL